MTEQTITLSTEKIKENFSLFKKNMDRISQLEKTLFSTRDKEKWLSLYKERSITLRKAFNDNERIQKEFNEVFSNHSLNFDQAVAFFDEIEKLNVSKYDDSFYLITIIDNLIDFFEKENDIPRLLSLYNRKAWEACACIRMGYVDENNIPLVCYKKVLNYQDKYSTFSDPLIRRKFFVAYYNIICVLPSMGIVSIDETTEYIINMQKLYNELEVMFVDNDNSMITDLYNMTEEKWLALDYLINNSSKEIQTFFIDTAQKIYKRQLENVNGDINKISIEALLAYNHSLVLSGQKSYMDVLNYLVSYYDKRRQSYNVTNESFVVDEKFYFESRMPDVLIYQWLNNDAVPENKHKSIRKHLMQCKNAYLSTISTNEYSTFVNESLTNWCFGTFKFYDTLEEKEYAVFNMIINRQISTFFHSHMVAILSELITDSLLTYSPEVFIGILGTNSVIDVINCSDAIKTYVRKCALFHDIGKNRITDIINLQYRKLSDTEFGIIKRHPELGAEAIDSDFSQYHDVIIGHHKTFDGKAGYPSSFDKTSSKVGIVLDIITICDTLDAATDYLGRNYARRKSYNDVLEELIASKNSRYNGEIVDILVADIDLSSKLDELIASGREEIYYNLFIEHFSSNWKNKI